MTSEDLKILDTIENVRFDEEKNCVTIIDQTLLPNETRYIDLCTPEEIWEAIHELRVRGAVAIGICAAYGMYCLSLTLDTDNYGVFYEKMSEYGEYLNSSRPTAVNLSWALQRINQVIRNHPDQSVSDIRELIKAECISMQLEDVRICTAISEYGLSLLKDGDGVLTHCNAGPLASSKYGTAQGPFYMSRERGMTIHVFADETRPLLQGARLTSYELARAGVDVTLICDNMASIVMKNGWIDACFVGCDRVAANGDAANKVGTSGVAILAKHYGIPFYVFCPLSTLDMNCASGNDIKIELRDEREIKEKYYEKPMALEEVKCYNPSFDVTDHELITAIVTEKGICYPPFTESLAKISQINL